MAKIAERQTLAENVRWNLSELFASLDDPLIQASLDKAVAGAETFERKYKGKIQGLSSPELGEAFITLEDILSVLYRLNQYATLLYAVNTMDDRVKAFEMKVREESAHIQNRLLFFDLELSRLSAEQARRHLENNSLQAYAYYLKRRLDTAKYNLTEKEEKLANLKDLTGRQAFKNLYEEFTTDFRFELKIDGQTKLMTGEELRALRQHEKAEVRRRAMHMFLSAYQDNHLVITNIFNQVIKDYNIERELRGYSSAINVRNVQNDLSDEAIRILHEITTESNVLVQRYYRIKAKLLKMRDMTLADIYAPLPLAPKEYTFPEAKDIVLEAFQGFDRDFYVKARSLFDENRLDAPVAAGKRGGAFCSSSVPELKPYVMLNFLGRIQDVSTLAHELGHAIHALYSQEQNLLNFHSILPLAETASVFSEMILTDHLLQHEQDMRVKRSLLTGKLEEIFATSHRQNMFSRFELSIHEKITRRLLSAQEFCKIYRHELELMFGDTVRIPGEYIWEWATIPHIVGMPFYVYAYNFANLLVMALFQQYQEQGKDFIPRFKKLLSLGSSASPTDIIAVAGAEINHPEFWRKSFTLIEGMIDKLETMLE